MEIEWVDQPVQWWQANAGEEGVDEAGDAAAVDDAGVDVDAGGDAGGDEEQSSQDALLDAINAGVDEADGRPAKSEDDADEETGEDDGSEQDPDAGDDEGDADEEEQEDDSGKDPAVDDPIPDEVKGRTRERIETLIAKVKEGKTQIETLQRDFDTVMGAIEATQATPEQYNMVLGYLGAVNSGDEAQIRVALEVLDNERAVLYQMLGEEPPGTAPAELDQDLKDRVEVGELSEEEATIIARSRASSKDKGDGKPGQRQPPTRQASTRQASSQEDVAFEQEMATARAAMNAVGRTLKATDKDYAAKLQMITPKVKERLATASPSKWVDIFNEEYAKAQVKPKPRAPQGDRQPLRGKQPAGGQQKAPQSVAEAIDAGIAEAGGR